MRFLVLLVILLLSENLAAQSILDVLSRPTQAAESELLRQVNEDANNQANAASKRAALLNRRANELRSQVDALEKKLAALEAEHAALKSAVTEGRDLVLDLFALLEKQELSTVPAQLAKIRSFYEKSLQPRLVAKPEPTAAEAGKDGLKSKDTPEASEPEPRAQPVPVKEETPPASAESGTSASKAADER